MSTQQPILQMTRIHKRFPGVKALTDVSLRLFPGEVHALMGENGAGKSTLIKVLTGVYSIDEGLVEMEGTAISMRSPQESQAAGISTVYQEVNLCPNLTVAENIFIGREPRRFGCIQWKQMNLRAAELLRERMNLHIDVTLPLQSYSVAVQQLVAIARALNISAKVLILDEPTSSLDQNEVDQLFRIMKKLQQEGLSILFVTHFLDQMYEISDRVTILRGGELVGEYMANELSRLDLVLKMIGKELHLLDELPTLAAQDKNSLGDEPAEGGRAGPPGRNRAVRPGDPQGRGRRTGRAAGFRADGGGPPVVRCRQAGLRASDPAVNWRRGALPREAIGRRIAFCSENRKTEGIIGDLTVRENIILALQAKDGMFKTIPRKRQEELAGEYIRMLNINPPSLDQLIKNLSGGNQQKVLLARWLLTEPELFILDEPTRGIDIGAKAEIQKLVLTLSRQGMSFLFISSELEEVLRVSDRIAILRDRRKVKEISEKDMSQQQIMQAIAGG